MCTCCMHQKGGFMLLQHEDEHGSGLGGFVKWGGKPHYSPYPYPYPCPYPYPYPYPNPYPYPYPTLPYPTQPHRAQVLQGLNNKTEAER
jgi:hypothetical protein